MGKKYDLVVFGATGFTAKFVLSEICLNARWNPSFTWAIAGRNLAGLDAVVNILGISSSDNHAAPPEVLVADVNDEESLLEMARSTKLLLNCVGPYRFFGEPVVKACIQGGCDYIDLCGEPEFIERMVLEYHQAAVEAGVTICPSAAFDSVPCDLGVLECKRILQLKGRTPSSVEMFLSVHTAGSAGFGIHYATYEAAVEGFSNGPTGLREVRKKLFKLLPLPKPPGSPLEVKKGFFGAPWDERVKGYLIPHFFSDPAVVRLSQALDAHLSTSVPPVHFAAYFVVPSLYVLITLVFYHTIFKFLTQRPWGKKLLLDHPKLFTGGLASKQGPSAVQLQETSCSMTFHALSAFSPASPKKTLIRGRITTPEPGYVATPILFVACAQAFGESRDKIPKGVLTPAVAFKDCGLLEKLNADGRVEWKVLEG